MALATLLPGYPLIVELDRSLVEIDSVPALISALQRCQQEARARDQRCLAKPPLPNPEAPGAIAAQIAYMNPKSVIASKVCKFTHGR